MYRCIESVSRASLSNGGGGERERGEREVGQIPPATFQKKIGMFKKEKWKRNVVVLMMNLSLRLQKTLWREG